MRRVKLMDIAKSLIDGFNHRSAETVEVGDAPCCVLLLNFCYSFFLMQHLRAMSAQLCKRMRGRIFVVSVMGKWPGERTPLILEVLMKYVSNQDPAQAAFKRALIENLQDCYDTYKDAKLLNGRPEEETSWVQHLRFHLL